MKIVFLGAVEFSRRVLEKVIAIGGNVIGVGTLKQSAINADFSDLTELALLHRIPARYCDDINAEASVDWIRGLAPDVVFCFGWSRLLKEEILSVAPLGVVGFHPAELPRNRGRHPIVWALVLGLKRTASTFFFMDGGVDSGDILSQRLISIDDLDDARSLYDKIVESALGQIEVLVPELQQGTYTRTKQDQSNANVWRKRGRADGLIDWRMDARSILNLVRGLSRPYVGAILLFEGVEYKVWRAELVETGAQNVEPGKVLDASGPLIKCGNNAIRLVDTEPRLIVQAGRYL